MAMPTVALAIAGASLTPSPTIATRAAGARELGDRVDLLLGQQVAAGLGDADLARDRVGDPLVVAGEHDRARGSRAPRSRSSTGRADGRGVSITPSTPRNSPPNRTSMTVRPFSCRP
jgi:hypothetical protein